MSAESDNTSSFGVRSAIGWPIGGIVGGAIGAAVFGAVIWFFQPEAIEAAIPSAYGIDPAGVTGWLIHIGHGAVLGLIFGFVVTRRPILSAIRMNPETETISSTSIVLRVVGAGFAYGIAVWAILPVIVLPVWTDTLGPGGGDFPIVAVESLLGHVLFGLILGLVFAVIVDLTDRETGEPLEG
ncbi:hypothetical protein OB955_17680 [Halobacteria archaeon AArc-m2/3/4]|uniref:Histidine kinase n=1 Tax=Natronoglomus mannanivorans TaxID=2979990 RepID=A0AAP2YZN8_9EURY|nr:hypothetical protein [Halobacteria archaeon AArc-xg1-1]MCU4974553.1 hypothetical protein [Halobacteria archaeon AArc-m2/3/4]